MWLIGIAVVVTVFLHLLYKRTLFGLGTSAVAENEGAAASLGWSPDLIATGNWALGSALAGLTGILIVPVIGLSVTGLTTLLLSALAAALVGRFSSFPVTLAGGLVIGVVQSELTRFGSDVSGLAASVPFLFIALVLVARGRALPLRGTFLDRLPGLGTGKVRPLPLALAVVAGLSLVSLATPLWADAITTTLVLSLIILSIVVVTGYAGQVSLAAYALAGRGAFLAGHAAADWGWPFELALLAGVFGTVPIGLLFALPAVRTRGVNLAIITLGLGTTLEAMVFQNTDLATTPGSDGIAVGKQTLFGISISGVDHPQRYAAVVLVLFVAATLVVANVRRSRTGRRLIAVRANERAAAALGIDVRAAKLYAFGLSSAIAALAGVLTGFRSTSVVFSDFASFGSVTRARARGHRRGRLPRRSAVRRDLRRGDGGAPVRGPRAARAQRVDAADRRGHPGADAGGQPGRHRKGARRPGGGEPTQGVLEARRARSEGRTGGRCVRSGTGRRYRRKRGNRPCRPTRP